MVCLHLIDDIVGKNVDSMTEHIKYQTEIAMEEANCIIFVVDAKEGLTKVDLDIAKVCQFPLHHMHYLTCDICDVIIRRDGPHHLQMVMIIDGLLMII